MSDEEKQRMLEVLHSSGALREQFMRVLAHKYEMIEKKGYQEAEYDDSGWVFKQAFNNGRLAMIKEIVDLFNFSKE